MDNVFDLSVIKTIIEDKKIKGFMVQSSNGDTEYVDIKNYTIFLENTNKKFKVRFPNESVYEDLIIDLDKFVISNEFEHEYFGWYCDTAIALKKIK